MLSALENALVVQLDALEGDRWPTWGLTTTTARPWNDWHRGELKYAEQRLFQQLRREHPGSDVQYLGFVEFTTGTAASSGGVRRVHVHHLLKGLGRPDESRALALERRVSELWRRYTGDAWRVECRPLRTPLGALSYLALHHHKWEQAPPAGWSGKRFRPSRGYFKRPVAELRAEARELMRDARLERALLDYLDAPEYLDAHTVEDLLLDRLEWAREQAALEAPKLVTVGELAAAGLRPARA